jgi:hypothetical protein
MKQIVTAMRSTNIKRIIVVSSQFTKRKLKNTIAKNSNNSHLLAYLPTYPFSYKLCMRLFLGRQLDALYEMEEFLFKESSDIDFTIVRPPRLLNDPLSS